MKARLAILFLFTAFVNSNAQSPGGVGTTNLKLWNKANAGVTGASPVTAWADQTSTNTFTVTGTGTPVLQSSALNYNPTILFDGNSRFSGNTAITNITHAFVVGKITAGGTSTGALIGTTTTYPSSSGQYFFHAEVNSLYSAGNATGVFTSFGNGSNVFDYSIFAEDLSKTPAASDVMRLNGVNKANVAGGDPAVISSAIPTIGSRTSVSTVTYISSGSEIAEAVLFNSSLAAADVNKVESYLAVKYGITLSTNYVNAAGSVVYNVSAYGSNVIGIARDDNAALTQKQSHQSNDATRIYLNTLAANNAANAGSFSSDAQFVMMGNNNAALANNTGNTEFPNGIGILGRMNREWKITNTGFTGSFSIDVTPTGGTYDASQLRLLIDDDGNFSNGGTSVFAPAFGYADGVVTIGNITTAMIPAGSTRYITLATVASPGAVSNNLTIWLKTDVGITQSAGAVSQWDDQSINALHVSQATAADRPSFVADVINYYPAVNLDGSGDVLTRSIGSGYNLLVNATSSTSSNTTGSIFTVAKSNTNGGNFFSQFPNPGCGNFVVSSGLVAGSLQVGGRSRESGTIAVANPATPFIATGLETQGTNNALHYYNGGNQQATTNVSNNICVPNHFLRVGNGLNGTVTEVITYNVKLTDIQRRQIESYLAVKYGITMSSIGGGTFGNYISTSGVTTWDASDNSSYHKQVIGIGRDDNTALLQKQSHTTDDTTRIYLSSLQTTNTGNSGSFSSNESFVMAGNNGGNMYHTYGNTEFPAGIDIYSRLDREWKISNTNFTGTFSMDFKLNSNPVTAADLRVLIDNDGNFTNASLYGSPDVSISYNSGVVTVSGLSTSLIPSGSTRYLTIASMNSTTPLPLRLLEFAASKASAASALLTWKTSEETNMSHFDIERSANSSDWEKAGTVAAQNIMGTNEYHFTDAQPLDGINYYRLKQTDIDGSFTYSPVRTVRFERSAKLRLYPNPASDYLVVEAEGVSMAAFRLYDALGRDWSHIIKTTQADAQKYRLSLQMMPPGMYVIKAGNKTISFIKEK